MDAFSAVIDQEKCMGCGICIDKCVQDAIHLVRDPSKGDAAGNTPANGPGCISLIPAGL
jgi:translation initiation factor RLI1